MTHLEVFMAARLIDERGFDTIVRVLDYRPESGLGRVVFSDREEPTLIVGARLLPIGDAALRRYYGLRPFDEAWSKDASRSAVRFDQARVNVAPISGAAVEFYASIAN